MGGVSRCFSKVSGSGVDLTLLSFTKIRGEKTNKQKTHKHFSDGPCGTLVPGTNPHPSQGQTGQNGDFTVEFNRKRPVCPRDGSQFVLREGPRLSQGRFLFVPETVPPKMFMFIGFFSCPIKGFFFHSFLARGWF